MSGRPVARRGVPALLILFVMLCALVERPQAAPAPGDPLVIDLSNHLVAISTGFAGATVLLFGAVEGDGDVVVVVRGPPESDIVRRKERILGIWVNRAQAVVDGVPGYYRVAASRPLDLVAAPSLLDHYQIGVSRLVFGVTRRDRGAGDADYRAAVLRLKEKAGLYGTRPDLVRFVGERLFRTEMAFPANVPTGAYTVEVYLLRNGRMVSARTTPLIVSKIGIGAALFDFASRQAPLYGLTAILLAAGAGWLAALVFGRS